MGKTSMLLKKYEQCKIAPTSDPMLDIAVLSNIRAQLSVPEIAITDQICVPVFWTPHLASTSMKFDTFNLR